MKRKSRSNTEETQKPAVSQKPGPNPPGVDYRDHPEQYKIARGEQGVLTVEPYKSEILPHWRFRDPAVAEESAAKIHQLYEDYKKRKDFVGMDMSRKYLQMGYTRAMRYANHKGGRKYDKATHELLPKNVDPVKIESAQKFHPIWKQLEADPEYQAAKAQHLQLEKEQKASRQ